MCRDLIERRVRREADVDRAGHRLPRLGLEFTTCLMKIELLIAEGERSPSLAERDGGHAEHTFVELDRPLEVRDRKDDVVDALDPHRRPTRCLSDVWPSRSRRRHVVRSVPAGPPALPEVRRARSYGARGSRC